MLKNNHLRGTSCYLVGQMQYADGTAWRNTAKGRLEPRGITCFDPYHKPFIEAVDESPETRDSLLARLDEGDYDGVAERMKKVRGFDLNLVDRCDFVIAYLNIKIPTCGSYEEIFWANRIKKPIFLTIEGGKRNTPLWLLGTIPHKYIYDSVEDSLSMIESIDSGIVEIDSDRWRLLKEEYR